MRLIVVALSLASAACSACSGRTIPVELPGIPFSIDPSLALSTASGAGHACPVNGEVITAAHVLWDETTRKYLGATYTFGTSEGYAIADAFFPYKDLARLQISGQVRYLPSGNPQAGDEVFWFEYDFRTQENAFRAHRRMAIILRVVAGLVIFDQEPVSGASGTCLINARGQVVGIVSSAFETQDGKSAGAALTLPQIQQ